jgi:glycosyltransferase involved in cell wall biosynthesis
MRTIAVIPAYQEATRIAAVVRALAARVDGVVVVDDGSRDDTAEVARREGARVLRHAVNRGQGAALKTGTLAALAAGAEAVVHFDADGQHGADALEALLAPLRQGRADVVLGSRFLGLASASMPPARRLLLLAARQFNRVALGVSRELTDPQSGLRALSARAAAELDFRQDRMAHCSEILRLLSRSHWRVVEVPVRVSYSRETLAKGQRASDALRILWHLVIGTHQR